MPKLFFLLSGETHLFLPRRLRRFWKQKAIHTQTWQSLTRFCAWNQPWTASKLSSTFSLHKGLRTGTACSKRNLQDIAEAAAKIDFKAILKEGESFVVRINRIKNYADTEINTMTLEIKLGGQILKQTPGAKVNLKNPDKTFIGIITDDKLILGLKLTEITPKPSRNGVHEKNRSSTHPPCPQKWHVAW